MYLFGVKNPQFKSNQMRCFNTFEEAYECAVAYCKQVRDALSTNGPLRQCDYGGVVCGACIWEIFPDKPPVRAGFLMDKLMKELWPE
jgi:hypothetical protein